MLFALKGDENGGGGNNSADHRILTECVIGVPLSVSILWAFIGKTKYI